MRPTWDRRNLVGAIETSPTTHSDGCYGIGKERRDCRGIPSKQLCLPSLRRPLVVTPPPPLQQQQQSEAIV